MQLGGTITGEHGVGVEKINSMCVQFSPAERAAFFAVKEAFDPAGLLNPGKLIPTLARCAEYGRMHVHARRAGAPGPAALLSRDDRSATAVLAELRERVARRRRAAARALRLRGAGTKDFYGERLER